MASDPWASVNTLGFAAIGAFVFCWFAVVAIIVAAFVQKRRIARPVFLVGACAAIVGVGALLLGVAFGGLSTG